jgi:hypothetical protein
VAVIEHAGQGLDEVVVPGLHPVAGPGRLPYAGRVPAIMTLIMSLADSVVSVLTTLDSLIKTSAGTHGGAAPVDQRSHAGFRRGPDDGR